VTKKIDISTVSDGDLNIEVSYRLNPNIYNPEDFENTPLKYFTDDEIEIELIRRQKSTGGN